MAYKPLFGSKAREQVWKLGCEAAQEAARGEFPICVHCDLPVKPGQDWDRAHVGVPRALGGDTVGVGHRRCNRLDNNRVVTPIVAKADSVRKKHLGIAGPGLGRTRMPCGRRSMLSKTMSHGVQPRLSLADRHAALLRARSFFGVVPQ